MRILYEKQYAGVEYQIVLQIRHYLCREDTPPREADEDYERLLYLIFIGSSHLTLEEKYG